MTTTATTCAAPQTDRIARQLRPAIVALLLLTLMTGVVYPLVVTGVAQAIFPYQANGSLIRLADGRVIGSELIGQQFDQPRYFWGRLSATGTFPYNAFNASALTASAGSNYGPLNQALVGPGGAIQARIAALRAAGDTAPPPVDLVTASASGLDPQISPAAAEYQVARVARERGIAEDQLRQLVAQHTAGRTLGLLGEPRVNVLELNLALDRLR